MPKLCAFDYALAIAFALVLGAAHLLDTEDHSAERARAEFLDEAQREAAAQARRDSAARAICAESHGTNAAVQWNPDGALVCSSKHGRGSVKHTAITASAAGVRP